MDIYKDRIRPLFDGSGLSDKEIAAELGIPVKLIYNWNNGVKSYNKYFDKIANYFHVSVEYLKGDTDDKNPPPVGDGLAGKINALAQSPGLLEELNRFLELAAEDPETARRFLAFAVQELQSSRPLR